MEVNILELQARAEMLRPVPLPKKGHSAPKEASPDGSAREAAFDRKPQAAGAASSGAQGDRRESSRAA